MFLGVVEDTQPELYTPENRETVKFNFFGSEKSSLMHKKTLGKQKALLEKIKDIIERKLYDELSEIKEEIKLDKSVFGFFDKCFLMNQLLSKHVIPFF